MLQLAIMAWHGSMHRMQMATAAANLKNMHKKQAIWQALI
jgi:hypothetical protein